MRDAQPDRACRRVTFHRTQAMDGACREPGPQQAQPRRPARSTSMKLIPKLPFVGPGWLKASAIIAVVTAIPTSRVTGGWLWLWEPAALVTFINVGRCANGWIEERRQLTRAMKVIARLDGR